MSYDLRPGLKKFFEKSAVDAPYIALVRDISRTFFEFLRMLVILGALRVVAEKSDNWLLHTLDSAAAIVMFLFVSSFFLSWNLKLFTLLSDKYWANLVDLAINTLLSLIFTFFGMYVVTVAVKSLSLPH